MKHNACGKALRPSRQERQLFAARFKVLLADAGLSVEEAAKVLHVSKRTVQHWVSGRVRIPYAAYRLVRILGRFELPSPEWQGWLFHSGKLWSPEGHGFVPADSNWWAKLCREAAMFRQIAKRQELMDVLMLRAGRLPPWLADAAGGTAARAEGGPPGEAGGAAQPPGPNLLLDHFGTGEACFRGETPSSGGPQSRLADANEKAGKGVKA